MINLPLNSLAVRLSLAFRDPKKARPGRIHLLVGTHNVRETVTAHQQPTGAKIFMLHFATNCNES